MSLAPLALGLPVCALAGGVVAYLIALVTGAGVEVNDPAARSELALRSAALASLTVALGSVAGLVLLTLLIARSKTMIAPGVVAAGVVRGLVSLLAGVLVFFLLHPAPAGLVFWTAFLVGNLTALVVESAWGMITNNHVHARAHRAGGTVGAAA